VAYSLEGLASLAAAQRRPERAMRLAGAAAALRAASGAVAVRAGQAQFARWLKAARRALGDTASEALWAEGQAMSLLGAIAFALEATGPD
jgi:hypothetical protein